MDSVIDPGAMVLFSPHLDDAAISCGMLLAASTHAHVVTLLAGVPSPAIDMREWDVRCGFSNSAKAMAARRAEDSAAMAILDVQGHYEDFFDSQYDVLPSVHDVAAAMVTALAAWRPDTVLVPLGLHHCDHERVHAGALLAMRQSGFGMRWLAYEDLPYAGRAGVMQSRLSALEAAGICATRVALAPLWHNRAATQRAGDIKTRALGAYASQLAAVGIAADAFSDAGSERYWLLQPNAE